MPAHKVLLAFVDGMVDNAMIDRDTLMMSEYAVAPDANPQSIYDELKTRLLTVGHVETGKNWDKLIPQMLLGNCLLFLEGVQEVLVLDTIKYQARSVGRAQSEPAVKGPQEAFNEIILTQMNLLRRRIPSADLRFESTTIGWQTHTTVILAYIDGVTNPALVRNVHDRLQKIERASVQTSNEVGEYLADRRWTIFPQIRMSERVDLIARNVTQGKVAILVANDPFAMLLPNTLMDFYQTTQDYSFPFWDGTLVRLVRMVGLAVGLYLMPLYIALSSVNPDLVPIKLILTISGSRQGMPFPPVAEVIIMWLIIEILREAANRLPQQLATTIGTVGAVVVGTAIVKAGLVDDIMIITVTLTALGLFTTPAMEMTATWRWLFWVFIIAAWIFGIYGIVLITVAVIIHLSSLENYGVPYLSPFGPIRLKDLRDSIVRFPFPTMILRPLSHRTLRPRQAKIETMSESTDLYSAQVRYRDDDPD